MPPVLLSMSRCVLQEASTAQVPQQTRRDRDGDTAGPITRVHLQQESPMSRCDANLLQVAVSPLTTKLQTPPALQGHNHHRSHSSTYEQREEGMKTVTEGQKIIQDIHNLFSSDPGSCNHE